MLALLLNIKSLNLQLLVWFIMNSKKALKQLYKSYRNNSLYHKSEILFLIIQIKHSNIDLSNYKRSLYLDIKKFIKFYIKSTDKKDYGYDKIEIEKLT